MFRWRLYIGLIVIMAMKSAGFADYTIPLLIGECLDYVEEHVKIEDLAVNVGNSFISTLCKTLSGTGEETALNC